MYRIGDLCCEYTYPKAQFGPIDFHYRCKGPKLTLLKLKAEIYN